MKKLVVLAAALALVPALAPAKAQALTEAQQNAAIAKLTAKMNCLKRFPLVSFGDYAAYSNQTVDNALLTWDDSLGSGNPDELQDAGVVSGVDFTFGAPFPPDVWAVGVRNTSTCRAKFGLLANPFARPVARMMRLRQFARVR
jgi:hypothetical protein